MKFAYEDLGDEQFEQLIVLLCQQLLGVSVHGFAKGRDGGRDAKFVGTAQLHPSSTDPWKGTVIIQAKHTNGQNRSFSEPDFFSVSRVNCVIKKEIPRIKKLRATQELDHYMLFANRRLTGNAENEIRSYISSQCNIPIASVYLCGLKQIELLMKRFPKVAELADIDPLDCPLIFSPEDLAEVVESLARHFKSVSKALDDSPIIRVSYKQKNRLNNMKEEYSKEQLKRYLKDTPQIKTFLAAPENYQLLEMYKSIVEEFQFKIISKRKDHKTFDKMMEYLLDLLFNRDPILKQNRTLTRAVLFYMYWNCDIGRNENASTD